MDLRNSNGIELKPDRHISRKDRKHLSANIIFKLSRYGLVSISLQ